MREIPDDILYDQRLIARHITQGLITQKEVDERLKTLRDVADHGEAIDLSDLQGEKKSPAHETPASDG